MTQLTLSEEQDQLQSLTLSAQQIADQCKNVTITDETTLAVAHNIFAKANDKAKEIEKLRVALKEPYFQAGKQIDAIAKAIIKPIEDAVLAGKQKIIAYDQHKKALADKEAKRIQGIRDEIQKYSAAAIEDFKNCKTDTELINLNTIWIQHYDYPHTWKELKDELHQIRVNLHQFATQRRIEINTPAEADETVSEVIESTIQEQIANVGSSQIQASSAEKTRGVGGTWKHRVDNKALVPANFLMVDDAAVKEYIKQNKDNIQNPSFKIPGVEFYFEPNVRL